jgi:hypothetical protein
MGRMIESKADLMQDSRPSTQPIVYKRRAFSSITELSVFSERGLFIGSLNIEICARTRAGVVLVGGVTLSVLDEGRIKLS